MYQDSVLDSLPHHWSSNYDTKLELKHFSRKQTNTMKQQNAASSVYMDINGDGILDQMHSITSTNPDSNPLLFKGSQCLGLANDCKLSTCPPTFIRNPETGELEVVHIVSNGMATSISPKGIENWKTDTNVQWDHTQEPYPYASVQPFSFYSQGHKSNVLVVGSSSMAILDNYGEVMITLSKMNEKTTLTRLVDTYNPVLAPPVIGDLNNDGYSDIILNTLHGYKVYNQTEILYF
ncbi:hypothetical protein DLAC_05718 [Tieghemostelium lacteum]|uniref:Tenascin X n=1 Tax=Tieghemostelium lacteum TaxID=361077 RepID=A0A151ZGP0_TIELA|nr:hypothetical protein DLAC_05718 [Tieghemostelium lacteum]|eukprot:KYQ93095.1 hypothetical protein DLAC_05718 [Tieghemostelium lacteum]